MAEDMVVRAFLKSPPNQIIMWNRVSSL